MEAQGSGSKEKAVKRSLFSEVEEYRGGKILKGDEPADFFEDYKDAGPTQPLSIQWLDLKKVFKHLLDKSKIIGNEKLPSPSKVIDFIVEIYNKERRKKNATEYKAPQYEFDSDGQSGGYLLKHFSMTSIFTRATERQTQLEPKETHKNDSLFFLYQEDPKRIIVLTTGDAWRVVSHLCDYSVPFKIAEKVANPKKIIEVERRCLFGRNVKEKLLNVGEKTSFQISNLYYLILSFKCDLKDESSLSALIDRKIKEEKEAGKAGDYYEDYDYNEDNEDDYFEYDDDKNEDKKNNLKKDRYWINVTRKGLRIGKRLRYKVYPAILDLLTKYREGDATFDTKNIKETADPLFKFLNFFHPPPLYKEELDKHFIAYIFSQYRIGEKPQVDIRHPRLEDYLLSNLYELQIGNNTHFKKIGSKPPELDELVEMILRKKIGNITMEDQNNFKNGLLESKLRFMVNENSLDKPTEPIINCLEGQISVSDQSYFKIHKVWYAPTSDYFSLLNADFREMIEGSIIKENTEWWLDRKWKEISSKSKKTEEEKTGKGKESKKNKGNGEGNRNYEGGVEEGGIKKKRNEEEGMYNRLYLDREGYIVFDKILPDGIEYCDILRYTEKAVYLYQVKKELGQHTREACSQILNAATVIRSAHRSPNFSEKLWEKAVNFNPKGLEWEWREKVAKQLIRLGKESFVQIFKNRKIVFVYAYVPTGPRKFFSHYLNEIKKPVEKSVISILIKSHYLDKYEELTDKFFSINKVPFIEEMSKTWGGTRENWGNIYNQLNARFLGTKSNIAKMELLHLSQNLQALGFELKICEIHKEQVRINQKS